MTKRSESNVVPDDDGMSLWLPNKDAMNWRKATVIQETHPGRERKLEEHCIEEGREASFMDGKVHVGGSHDQRSDLPLPLPSPTTTTPGTPPVHTTREKQTSGLAP